jgi:hypothetical protein
MDAEPNEETGETGSQSQSGSEEQPKSRLRDLSPEKDPMGAGVPSAAQKNTTLGNKMPNESSQ